MRKKGVADGLMTAERRWSAGFCLTRLPVTYITDQQMINRYCHLSLAYDETAVTVPLF